MKRRTAWPITAAHYTAMLQSAYTAIKAEDPSITVVVGGLASVDGYDDGDKTVWITEAGIPTCVFLALYPCVSRAEQAELLTTEFALWQTYDWAGGYIVYDLRDDCSSFLNVQCNFGVVTRGNNYKPAWVGLRTAWLNE